MYVGKNFSGVGKYPLTVDNSTLNNQTITIIPGSVEKPLSSSRMELISIN